MQPMSKSQNNSNSSTNPNPKQFLYTKSKSQNQKIKSIVNYKDLYEQEKRLRISIESQLEIQKIKVKKLLSGRIKGKVCPNCLEAEGRSHGDNHTASENIVQNLKQFSTKISSVISNQTMNEQLSSLSKKQPSTLNLSVPLTGSTSLMSNSQVNQHVPIFQNFAVYGVSDQTILSSDPTNNNHSVSGIGGEVLYSLNTPSQLQKQAVNFIFPAGVAVKRLSGAKAKDKAIEIMSYCYTNLKSFVLGFKAPNHEFPQPHYDKNELLKYVNKERNMFFICIGVKDYTWIDNRNKQKKMIISLDEIEQSQKDEENASNPSQKRIHSQGQKQFLSNGKALTQTNSEKSLQNKQHLAIQQIALTQRVFCISSYFPFFTFFEQIIRSLINNIKMQRLHMYKLNSEDMPQTIQQTDSKFQIQRISELFNHTIGQICSKKMQFNRSYELKLINQQKISLLTDWSYARTYFIDEWIFTIISMFTMDTFLDLWTEIILQQGKGVVFICENSHILTYAVYLFGNLLCKPFAYAYPVVNIVPDDEDFLDSPFPVIYGMFKKRKYVEENKIIERYNDRTYVFLNPEKIDIIYSADSKKNIQKRKPSKLKNELNYQFKELKKHRKKQTRSAKYEIETPDYCYLSSLEERQASIQIISTINDYIQNQIVQRIPTKVQIEQRSKKIDPNQIPAQKTVETFLISQVVESIRKNSKDPFLQRFLQTQTFSNYLLEQSEMVK